jgi:eukaryotic-like serine/threonine-protein kinase
LKEAAGFYAELETLLAGQSDARSRKALAAAYAQLGDLTVKIGSIPEALAVHRKALALRRELAVVGGADVETRLDVARSLFALGDLLFRTDDSTEALSAFHEQCDLAAALEAESPTDAVRVLLAFGHNGVGFVLQSREKLAEALECFGKALAFYQKLPEAGQYEVPGQGPTFGLQLQAGTYFSIGEALSGTGKRADALESYLKALDIMEKLANAYPANTTIQKYLAMCREGIGIFLNDMGRHEEALAAWLKALAIRQKLADANPAVSVYQSYLANAYGRIGDLLERSGRPEEAMEADGKMLAISQKLVDANPTVPEYQRQVAGADINLGGRLARQKRSAEAITAIDAGLAIARKLVDTHPENPWSTGQLGDGYASRG